MFIYCAYLSRWWTCSRRYKIHFQTRKTPRDLYSERIFGCDFWEVVLNASLDYLGALHGCFWLRQSFSCFICFTLRNAKDSFRRGKHKILASLETQDKAKKIFASRGKAAAFLPDIFSRKNVTTISCKQVKEERLLHMCRNSKAKIFLLLWLSKYEITSRHYTIFQGK